MNNKISNMLKIAVFFAVVFSSLACAPDAEAGKRWKRIKKKLRKVSPVVVISDAVQGNNDRNFKEWNQSVWNNDAYCQYKYEECVESHEGFLDQMVQARLCIETEVPGCENWF